ncbi:hypothetical protein CABS03_06905 [Colletotrichum abscissum]|uniref:Uncharacterized protein n=1 Tax=Colletotrichum abscissum TaxID=1671311 RepID=A0A9P9XBW2_9PEZI|nr:hypothetical protein CABS02_08785 [Colletotrichum abscissum]
MPSLGREAGDVALESGEAGLGWLSANGARLCATHRYPCTRLLLWLAPGLGESQISGFCTVASLHPSPCHRSTVSRSEPEQ